MPERRKVKFGLKNVYYAVATIAEDGSATYATPKRIPGAVNLSLDPQGETTVFNADDIAYYVTTANNGYSGPLEIALVPESFEVDVLGMIADENIGMIENADAPTVHFALLFEINGDASGARYVMYNCTTSRSTVGSTTKGENVEVQTETLNLTARTIWNEQAEKNIVKAYATSDKPSYANWFTAVQQPAA